VLTPFRKRALGATALVLAGLGFVALTRAQFMGSVNELAVNLAQPDVLVRSTRLSDLPKDLAQAPLLKGILTDDVVHYYQDHPTRLSLLGTLKRLAYDHQLTWSDRLVATVIDAPAELSFWRDAKGRPEHFMLVLRQNVAAQALQQLAKVGLPDDQLSVAGEIDTPKGAAKVYALKVNQRNTWLLVSTGDRLVVLSDPGLLLEADRSVARDSHAALTEVFKDVTGTASPQAASLGLMPLSGLKQQITARGDYLSFGYQPFFSGLDAVRVEQNTQGQWQLSAKMTPAALKAWQDGARQLWQAVPQGHALCVALPMDWALGAQVLGHVAQDSTVALLQDLRPVAATCWNQGGGINAPMLAAQLKRTPKPQDDLAVAALLTDVTRKKAGKNSGAEKGAPIAATLERTLPGPMGGKAWVRRIPHELGNVSEDQVNLHKVSAARLGSTLMAAIDEDSLGQAVAVSRKSFPTMADERRSQGVPVMIVDSNALAQLLEAETWATLTPEDTPTFYRVARQLLPARLKALRALGRWQVTLPEPARMAPRSGSDDATRSGWVKLHVQTLR